MFMNNTYLITQFLGKKLYKEDTAALVTNEYFLRAYSLL